MTWTHHGGRLVEARAAFGETDVAWLDLSTGINPNPWPGTAGLAIDWARLPDEHDLHTLENAAAAYFGVDPEHVAALPGTEMGLRLLGALLDGPAHHLAPTYRTHEEMFAGSTALSDLANAAGGVVVVANPNNPDGRVRSAQDVIEAGDCLAARGGWLVVDEAFVDAHGDDTPVSIAGHVCAERRLIVFRSFGKFFGLAGVRLGFVIAPRGVIAQVRARLGAWPVSAAAIAIGTAAYRDTEWIGAMRDRLARDVAALDGVLTRRGLVPVGACPLFRLIEVDDAAAMFRRLAQTAILTRPFAYNSRWLRLGLPGSGAALDRLERSLANG